MDFSTFRQNIRALIDARGYTQEEVGKACGLTSVTISRYVSDTKHKPKLEPVVTLASFFNVSLDWFLGLKSSNKAGERSLEDLYNLASSDDRKAIDTILRKYQEV